MEDLRPEEEKTEEILNGSYSTIKLIFRIWFSENKKKIYKYSLIGFILLYVLINPVQIGTFIGDWGYGFYTSITKNFKN